MVLLIEKYYSITKSEGNEVSIKEKYRVKKEVEQAAKTSFVTLKDGFNSNEEALLFISNLAAVIRIK